MQKAIERLVNKQPIFEEGEIQNWAWEKYVADTV